MQRLKSWADWALCSGAGRSKGRTSWQAKPELDDYISFVGFFVHYVEGLRVARPYTHSYVNADTTLSPIPSACGTAVDPSAAGSQGMILVIGGYSYGSLIATHLPTTDRILQRFEMVCKGTAEAETRLRAISLSAQWKKDARCYREGQYARKSGSHEKLRTSTRAMGIAIGGDESNPGTRRTSHEGRRSMDAVRRSMDRSRMKLGLRQHSHSSEISERAVIEESLAPVKVLLPQTHYLLISPLLPPISMFATMFSKRLPSYQDKLVRSPTFAVYGDDDFFTSQSKLRRWAEGLKAKPESQFCFHEVPGAGHFWREEGSDRQMRSGIRQWMQDVSD